MNLCGEPGTLCHSTIHSQTMVVNQFLMSVLQRQETDSVASAVLKLIDQKIKMELASHLLVLQRTQNELLEPICP